MASITFPAIRRSRYSHVNGSAGQVSGRYAVAVDGNLTRLVVSRVGRDGFWKVRVPGTNWRPSRAALNMTLSERPNTFRHAKSLARAVVELGEIPAESDD